MTSITRFVFCSDISHSHHQVCAEAGISALKLETARSSGTMASTNQSTGRPEPKEGHQEPYFFTPQSELYQFESKVHRQQLLIKISPQLINDKKYEENNENGQL
jgi:hypothetical protein